MNYLASLEAWNCSWQCGDLEHHRTSLGTAGAIYSLVNLAYHALLLTCKFVVIQKKKKNELLLKFNIILKLLLYYALKKLDHPLILLIRRLYQPQNPDW